MPYKPGWTLQPSHPNLHTHYPLPPLPYEFMAMNIALRHQLKNLVVIAWTEPSIIEIYIHIITITLNIPCYGYPLHFVLFLPRERRSNRRVPASAPRALHRVQHPPNDVPQQVRDIPNQVAMRQQIPSACAIPVVVEPRPKDEVGCDGEEGSASLC